MRIDPVLAETVAAVVDEGTFDAAAQRLHITPSAVSQRVRALETHLGRVLVIRSRPARATEAGTVVVQFARRLALLAHEATVAFGEDADEPGRVTTVPLAVNADSLATWMLAPLQRVAERHPVVFDLHRDDESQTTRLLETATVVAAVTSEATPVSGCTVAMLGVMRYRAVASPAFVERWLPEGGTTEEIERAPVVDFDRNDDLQSRWMRAVGADPHRAPRHRVPASQDFARAVAGGLGWGMLPPLQSAPGLEAGTLMPLGGDGLDVPLYWQQWNLRSPVLDEIATEVRVEAERALRPRSSGGGAGEVDR